MALCPICQQPLPDTPVRFCPNCGAEFAQSPPPPENAAPGPPPFEAGGALPPTLPGGPSAVPWDERERLGTVNALVETTRQVLAVPGAFFRSMPTAGGIGSPLLYAVIVGWLGLIVASLYQAVFRSLMGSPFSTLGDRPEVTALVGWVEGWAGFVMQVALGGIFVVIGVFVGAGILHLFLLLLGGARSGFETTVRVVCFAQATSVVFLVPFCGQLVAGIWTLVLYIIGLAAAHRIGHGKAAAATLLPIALLCCCCVGLAALFAGALASIVGHTTR
ncbi:MAG TPA: YIP1 family protein [Vicinamibacteria bacterium]|nr:YIP1 family protein [Vicinamibacteria bacterium]